MSNVIDQSTADTVRMRLEFLRTHHHAAVRSGDERLRAAMAEYAQSTSLRPERDPASRSLCCVAG